MRVTVIGAGVAGVCTAHELALAGHEVRVLERRASVAAEGSFAPSGLLSPGWLPPWPGGSGGGIGAGAATLPWLRRLWRTRQAAAVAPAQRALFDLARLSRQRLLALTRELELDFEHTAGVLLLARGARDARRLQAASDTLQQAGHTAQWVEPSRARAIEPAMNPAAALTGALHLPQDGAGNGRQFAHQLKAQAQRLGVSFHFGQEVRTLRPGRPVQLQTVDGQTLTADAVVLCTGASALRLLAGGAGRGQPLATLYGASVTAPLGRLDSDDCAGPRTSVVDVEAGVVVTRLGDRVRVAQAVGARRVGQAPATVTLQRLHGVLERWFPGAAVQRQAQHWLGTSAATPDGLPLVGPATQPGVWLNLAHGAHGWALACGAAQALAAGISGTEPPLDLRPYSPDRLR